MAFPWDGAQLGLSRSITAREKQEAQQACAPHLVHSLSPSELSHTCKETDKVFCSTWLDHDNVVIGTKCNRLRQVHIPTRTWHELAYPPQPVHRLGPDLLATGNRAHCGQHDLAVSPSGAFMVSGGTAAEDQVLWRLQQRQPSQEQEQEDSSSGASSSMQLQPVQTFMGHADWVFGLDWLSDRHWVSGSRDGTVKLWQVPDAAHAPTPSPYTPEPGCPLLSVSYHAGKVRAIQFDRQQQQLVALATDDTMSWWTPDLQLKGSAKLARIHDPVALATCGDMAVVGCSGCVLLLDTRAPNAGLLRGSSGSGSSGGGGGGGSNSLAGSKRSRTAYGYDVPALSGLQQQQQQQASPVPWLPQAYSWAAPGRTVLGVTGALQGLQQLQTISATVGMDPLLAEQVLRQEAAILAITQGKTFDAMLQGLVNSQLKLQPAQQLQELAALQRKHTLGWMAKNQQQQQQQQQQQEQRQQGQPRRRSSFAQVPPQPNPAAPTQVVQPQLAQLGRPSLNPQNRLSLPPMRPPPPSQQQQLPRPQPSQQQQQPQPARPRPSQQQPQLQRPLTRHYAQQLQQQQQQQQQTQPPLAAPPAAAAAAATGGGGGVGGEPLSGLDRRIQQRIQQWQQAQQLEQPQEYDGGSQEALQGQYDEGSEDMYSDGEEEEEADESDEFDDGGVGAAGAVGRHAAALENPDLPNALRYLYERQHPLAQYAMNGGVPSALQLQLRQQQQLATMQQLLPPAPQLQARVSGVIKQDSCVVRSLSLANDYVLGVGQTGLDFFDLRRMQGNVIDLRPRSNPAPPDPALLLRRVTFETPKHLAVDPVLLQHGYGYMCRIDTGVFTHCWDPSGTRMVMAGGALALGCKGGFMQLLA